ncbi:unnamed protein product, partial [Brassica rapa subsp. trilocularis]
DLGAEEKSNKKKPELKDNNLSSEKKKRKKKKPNLILVRGKRFTKEEDELIKKAVLGYVEAHVLGDQGINMVMNCRSHPQIKGCWKEITHSLPWRPHCAFQEKRSQHGMLRDDIPWTAISDQLGTRNHALCCQKWYNQLTSPMVAKGIWANVDDYRLLDELTNLDAACVDWNQMVRHIGLPGAKTFAEQVEIISQRYCPDIAEDREDFDNRPYED